MSEVEAGGDAGVGDDRDRAVSRHEADRAGMGLAGIRTPRWLDVLLLGVALFILAYGAWGLIATADSGEVGRSAGRLNNAQQVTPIVPPPSAAVVCNSMTYVGYDPGPSGICFRAVTAQRGWSEARTNAWFPFIISEYSSVVQGESAHCWNVRRNEIIEAGEVCNEANKTIIGPRGEDAGFGGATSSLWGDGAILCEGWGVCSWQQIVASPYTSMLYSIVIPVEELGSKPWCYSARSVDYHDCWEAPDR